MTSLTVTAKGQITLRKDLLQHIGAQPGSRLTVQALPNGRIEISAARPSGKISSLRLVEARGAEGDLDRGDE
jgi:bifunctional DNA-binding transcriptional regulator/antitoxin component of YhaV-PrlF toxin-antitoxin module